MDLGGKNKGLTIIQSAYYIPNISSNLLSVSYLLKQGFSVNFNHNECQIFCNKDQELCGIAKEVDGLFILKAKPVMQERAYISLTTRELNEDLDLNPESHKVALIAQTKRSIATLETWHRQLCHISLNAVKQLSKYDMVTGMEISPSNVKVPMCIPCLEGKQMWYKIPSQSKTIHPRLLYRVYSDLCGPMQTRSHQGEYYFLTFIDGNAHHVKVKLLVTKSKTCKMIIALIECAEVETGEQVNFFHSNGGGEFGSKELADYFE